MDTRTKRAVTLKIPSDAPDGSFEAVFTTFDVVDADGEVVVRDALVPHHQKEIPIVWGHDWHGPAIGKGRIEVDQERARVVGQFNLNSTAGKDAYETVKFMGGLQEYSWGFGVKEWGETVVDGQKYPSIRAVEPIEVSPVLIGSNPQTGTMGIKNRPTTDDDWVKHGQCPECGHVFSKSDSDPDEIKAQRMREFRMAEFDLATRE